MSTLPYCQQYSIHCVYTIISSIQYTSVCVFQGYKQRNAYIATQGPLQNTVNDMWRMMWEFKSKTMVTLCNLNEDGAEACHPFWPGTENEAVKFGKVVVTLQSTTSYDHFVLRKYTIQEDKVKTQTLSNH